MKSPDSFLEALYTLKNNNHQRKAALVNDIAISLIAEDQAYTHFIDSTFR